MGQRPTVVNNGAPFLLNKPDWRKPLKIWLMEFPQEYDHRLDYLVMYRGNKR